MAAHVLWILLLALLASPPGAGAQRVVDSPQSSVLVVKGQTALILQPVALQRLSIANPEIAEVFAVSPQEILVNGKALGSTSLLLWDSNGGRRLYSIEVVPDTAGLQQTLRTLFPGEDVRIALSGSSLILSGRVSDPAVAHRINEVVEAAGSKVLSYLTAPPAPQVLLQVRFAEVSRTALREFGTRFSAITLDGGPSGAAAESSSSDGILRLSLFDPDFQLDALVRALQTRGLFRSLAEPNLMARNNEEASFLAGGEFPFPVVQNGQSNSITVVWKEFGVRLRFRPTILPNGVIRLKIAPEVSSLDYANALRLSDFLIPSLLTRRAETEVELRPGQSLAIAGLLDNSLKTNSSKIPLLGDIPILGELFRSREARESRTELLVLVSPHLVQPSSAPLPVPTGEPGSWPGELVRTDTVPVRR